MTLRIVGNYLQDKIELQPRRLTPTKREDCQFTGSGSRRSSEHRTGNASAQSTDCVCPSVCLALKTIQIGPNKYCSFDYWEVECTKGTVTSVPQAARSADKSWQILYLATRWRRAVCFTLYFPINFPWNWYTAYIAILSPVIHEQLPHKTL